MAKLSGLVGSGKLGEADQRSVDALPDAPRWPAPAVSTAAPVAQQDAPPPPLLPKEDALESNALPEAASVRTASSRRNKEGADVTRLRVAEVFPSRYQVRAVADDEYIESLMLSIRESGVISPIVVRPLPKNEALESNAYEIVAGHHRFEACRRLGYSDVNVTIRHMTDAEAARALASDNLVRKDLDDYERFKHAKMLKENGFCQTNSEIGVVLGVSRTLVSFLMAFDAFPTGAKAILETHPGILGASQANGLKDIATEEPDAFSEALVQLADGKLQQNQIRQWIERKFRGPAVRMHKRRVLEISRPGLASRIKVTYSGNEAKIQSADLNIEKLQKLIEDNLDDLIS